MKREIKFNKKRCMKCMYHGKGSGSHGTQAKGTHGIYCNYASITGHTALQSLTTYQSYDTRGDDFYNCLLFEEGVPKRERRTTI